ncbi:tyrosine-type recombinase/integrase [Aquisalimonas asiatica]|uniref:Site-specific recombinase XerD n=1 Tax=Aquisalimonas asiatica TaxID=406100 RepID=A0A1H8UC47_9GAMM|nr:tyrosine-type recombinase/integrase [Aquisalimonas asiatica]SEP00799.1 Site-specific recombinase XerD [Aquisalimonas asiatica]
MATARQKGHSTSTRTQRRSLRINATNVKRHVRPTGGAAITLWDTDLGGFGVVLGKTRCSYKVFRQVRGGRQFTRTLGGVDEIGAEEARAEAERLIALCKAGTDPGASPDQGGRLTLGGLFNEYLAKRNRLKESTRQSYRRCFDKHFSRLRDIDVREITRGTVLDWRDAIIGNVREEKGLPRTPSGPHDTTGLTTGDFAVTILRAMFALAIEYQLADLSENPAKLPKGARHKPKPRTRTLADDELPLFHEALQAEPSLVFRHFLTLLLLTGCRAQELAALPWSDVNTTGRTADGIPPHAIRLRAERTKSGRERFVPLSDWMLEELLALRALRGGGVHSGAAWVFPSVHESKHGHIHDGLSHVHAAADRAGIPRVSQHDLRRTYTSVAARLNLPYAALVALTGHAPDSRDVTLVHYIHLGVDDLRAPQQAITDELKRLCGLERPAADNVTTITTGVTHA